MSRVRIRVNTSSPTLSPTKTSQLVNDSDFQTGMQVAAAVALEAAARETADNALATAIANEETARSAADNALNEAKVDKIPGKGLSTNDYTDAEKTKLADIEAGAEVNNVFMAVYGATTYEEIVAAQQAGKTVLLRYGSIILSASKADSSDILFTGVYFYEGNDHATRLLVCSVNSNSVWSEAARFLEWETHKVTTMGASSTDIQYPSAKAVYDALQERLAKNDANARIVPGYGGSAVYGTDYDGVEPSAGMKAFCFSAYQEIKPALWPTGNADVSIGTAEELIAFAISSQTDNYAGRKVVLTADIDLNPGWIAGSSAPEQAWTPIGNIDTRFNGTFDGQGHTISGVYLNATEKYQGLFGCTGEDAIIQNFKLKNSYFTSTGDYLGSIAGYAAGLFEKIYSEAVVFGKSNYIGGLFGINAFDQVVTVNDCWFAGSATINAAKSYLGGLTGGVQSGGFTINNCLNTGEVAHKYTGTLMTAGTGGFVGTAQGAVTITNSVNHTNPSYQKGSGNGLFVGYGSGAVTLTNCHAINHGGKHLVNGVTNDSETYPTCSRQNAADVAGTKSVTTAKVQNLFLSDGAQGHWVCSVDSLPVLADFTGYLRRFELSDGNNAVSPDQPIPAGSDISIKAGYSASFAGIIIAGLTTSSTEVIVQLYRDYPSNWAPANHLNAPSSGYLWFPSYPDAGVIEKGNGASTLGEGNKANEEGAFAAGRNNIADGRYSAAFGDNNKVGYAGAAFGNDNEVYGILSVAAGIGNRIIGAHSVALGYYNEVSGDSACAFGHGNKATADHAQAFGWQTKAAGANSYTEGLGTHAIQFCQHARGKFNVEDRDGLYTDIVGWGTADNARKNISALTRWGDLKLKGSVYVHSNDDSSGGYDLDEKIDKAFILRTASGNPAAFDDGADGIPVKSLTAEIAYKTSGSTSCTVSRSGKNLLDDTKRVFAGGNIFFGGATSQTAGLSAFLPSGDYTISVETADGTATNLYVKDKLKNEFVSGFPAYDKKSQSFTLDAATEIIVFVYKLEYTSTSDILTAQIEVGDFATAYTPYAQIATYSVDWSNEAGTVYGGALNVTTGVLTSTLDENGGPLPAPTTYQLTPLEVTTLLGDNVFSADTGDVIVTYRADPTKVIEKLTAAVLSLGGNV